MENRLRDALRHDRARVQVGKISRFGLLELSRQRLQPSLEETTHSPCPRCHGTGYIRDTASTALHVLRILQEEAMKENTAAIHAQVPVDVATYLLNEKRSEIFGIEARLKVNVLLIPNPNLATPNYHVERLRHDATQLDEQKPSYEMVMVPDEEPVGLPTKGAEKPAPRPEPLVKGIRPDQPAPVSAPEPEAPAPAARVAAAPPKRYQPAEEKRGLLDTLFGWLKKPAEPAPAEPRAAQPKPALEERAARDPQRGRDGKSRDRDGRRPDARRGEERNRGEDRGGRGGRDGRRGEGRREEGRDEARRDNRNGEGRHGEPQKPQQPQQPRREGRRDEGRQEGRPEGRGPQQNRPPRQDEAPRAESTPVVDAQAPRLESHPVQEARDGEGGTRRRRRRGGRGGERGERGERAPREVPAAEGASPADAIEAHAAHLESARAPEVPADLAPAHEPRRETPPLAPVHEPVASAAHVPVAFHAVSEHDQVESPDEAHRPARRRRQDGTHGEAQAQPLQLVETQAPVQVAPEPEDEAPRRTKPRRRRGGPVESEPLQLVETTHSEEPRPENPAE